MSEPHESSAYVPEYLQIKTIKTLPLDVPYFLHIKGDPVVPDDEPDDRFWVDRKGELRISGLEEVSCEDASPVSRAQVLGRIGIMKTIQRNESLKEYYVADLRQLDADALAVDVEDETQAPSDEAMLDVWRQAAVNNISIDGIVYRDENNQECYSGSEAYRAAAEYLARSADQLPHTQTDSFVCDDTSTYTNRPAAGKESENTTKIVGDDE